jgi:hypothetical protein
MAIRQRASGIIAYFQSFVDKVISPDSRKEYYSKIAEFAQDQPILFVRFLPFYPLDGYILVKC